MGCCQVLSSFCCKTTCDEPYHLSIETYVIGRINETMDVKVPKVLRDKEMGG